MQFRSHQTFVLTVIAGLAFAACSSDDTGEEPCTGAQCAGGAGGSVSTGGARPAGGAANGGARTSGGTSAVGGVANGGVANGGVANGGAAGQTAMNGGAAGGGAASKGGTAGTTTTGGAIAVGGAGGSAGNDSVAGNPSTGGVVTTGGTTNNAGAPSTGGTTGVAGSDSAGSPGVGGTAGTAGDASAGGTAGAAGADNTAGAAGAAATAAFCANGTHAFCDDFEDGDAAGWTAFEQYSATVGTWVIGTEAGYNGATSVDYRQTAIDQRGYHYRVADTAAGGPWTDQTVSAWVKPNSDLGGDNTKVGICARVSGTSAVLLTGYCMFIRNSAAGAGEVQLSTKPNTQAGPAGKVTTPTTSPAAFLTGTWYHLALEVSGSTSVVINGYINGVLAVTYTDAATTATSGYPALITRQQDAAVPPGTASFDNVTLTTP